MSTTVVNSTTSQQKSDTVGSTASGPSTGIHPINDSTSGISLSASASAAPVFDRNQRLSRPNSGDYGQYSEILSAPPATRQTTSSQDNRPSARPSVKSASHSANAPSSAKKPVIFGKTDQAHAYAAYDGAQPPSSDSSSAKKPVTIFGKTDNAHAYAAYDGAANPPASSSTSSSSSSTSSASTTAHPKKGNRYAVYQGKPGYARINGEIILSPRSQEIQDLYDEYSKNLSPHSADNLKQVTKVRITQNPAPSKKLPPIALSSNSSSHPKSTHQPKSTASSEKPASSSSRLSVEPPPSPDAPIAKPQHPSSALSHSRAPSPSKNEAKSSAVSSSSSLSVVPPLLSPDSQMSQDLFQEFSQNQSPGTTARIEGLSHLRFKKLGNGQGGLITISKRPIETTPSVASLIRSWENRNLDKGSKSSSQARSSSSSLSTDQ